MSTWDEMEFDYIWEELLNESKYNYEEYQRPALQIPIDYYDYYEYTEKKEIDENGKQSIIQITYEV